MAAPDPEDQPTGPRRRPTEAERRAADADPGVPWREWFYFSFLKVWTALGFLVVDALLVGFFAEAHSVPGVLVGAAVALYLEFLAYQVLWRRPAADEERSTPYRPSFYRPVRYGRWTPEAWHPEAFARHLPGAGAGPDPNEFL
jgi:hypothetical protein